MEKKELDEYMEAIWYLSEEEDPCVPDVNNYVKEAFTREVVGELTKLGLITVTEDGKIEATEAGHKKSRQIVRCHRLAERLLTDVLGMKPKETEKGACDFEHIVVPEIADSICTLLGHPRECPHGLRIPDGECCKGARETFTSAIVPLDRIDIGTPVKVAYISTPSNSRMHKLTHFGIMPGSEIRVHQRYPSFIIQCGNTQVAMEEDVAKDIFVIAPLASDKQHGHRRRLKRMRPRGTEKGTA